MRYALEEVVYFELNKRLGRRFPEYTEENFGSQWLDDEECET